MKLTISGRQMTLRDSLKTMAEEKLSRYDRFFGDEAEGQVTFSCRHGQETVEVTINSNGTVFRAEEGADTFRTALDSAMDALDRQIRKNKTRLEKRMRSGAYNLLPAGEDLHDDAPPRIRTKTFAIKPMSAEEAILQILKQETAHVIVKSKTINASGIELTTELRTKDATTAFVNRISVLPGVENATLVSYNGEYL